MTPRRCHGQGSHRLLWRRPREEGDHEDVRRRGDRALGRRLVPLLVANGHQVTAMTRRVGRTMDLYAAGAEPVVADALDRDAVLAAVTAARPDAVVHQLTDLAGVTNLRKFDQGFAATACAPRAPTTCWRRRGPPGPAGSSPRASPGGRSPGRRARSRPRTTRSTPTRRPSCGAPWTPSGTSSRPCSGPRTWRGSSCATAASTAPAPRPGRAATCSRTSAGAASR